MRQDSIGTEEVNTVLMSKEANTAQMRQKAYTLYTALARHSLRRETPN